VLVLSRKCGEVIVIGENITVTVLEVQGSRVKLGFVAPTDAPIYRAEIYERREHSLPLGAYVEAALARIRRVRPAPDEGLAVTANPRDAPRVPFGSLVERGVLPAGTVLTDRTRRVAAVVVADGSIRVGAVQGSIHKVGAAVQNAPSCNGWMFWHIERDGVLVAIDALRTAPESA